MQTVMFLSPSSWTRLDTRTQKVFANNTDCSDVLGANNSDSEVWLTPVDRKFLLQGVLRLSKRTVRPIQLLDECKIFFDLYKMYPAFAL